ncbi:MAG TPA: hypothetical protein VFN61_04565 [Acidimicrobiales bacterium]|nr:hypothetical protein [Acidimicrobiales bacterium]
MPRKKARATRAGNNSQCSPLSERQSLVVALEMLREAGGDELVVEFCRRRYLGGDSGEVSSPAGASFCAGADGSTQARTASTGLPGGGPGVPLHKASGPSGISGNGSPSDRAKAG